MKQVMAPSEGVIPISILTDTHCEELAHPHLFPTGKFGYRFQRKVESKLSILINAF